MRCSGGCPRHPVYLPLPMRERAGVRGRQCTGTNSGVSFFSRKFRYSIFIGGPT